MEEVIFKVLGWNAERRVWTLRATCSGEHAQTDAQRRANYLRSQGLRVRIMPGKRKVLTVQPDIISETRDYRFQVAGQMSDLADAKKRYKSPG